MEMGRSKPTKEEVTGEYNETCMEGQGALAHARGSSTTADLGSRVLRLELQDIGRILEFTCKYCLKSVQLVKLRDHQLTEHSEELGIQNGANKLPDSPLAKERKRKRYHCRFCPKSFIMKSQCRSHENAHPTPAAPSTKDIKANGKTIDAAEGGILTTMAGGNPVRESDQDNESNGSGAEEVRKCKTCHKVLPAPLLLAHIYTHCTPVPEPEVEADKERKGRFSCSLCKFNTRSCSYLKDHMAVMHYRIKRHICLNCKKARFGWHSALIKHSRRCTGLPELPLLLPDEERNQQPQKSPGILTETTPGPSRKCRRTPTPSPRAEIPQDDDDQTEDYVDTDDTLGSRERATKLCSENTTRKKLNSKTSKVLPRRPRGQKSRVKDDGQAIPPAAKVSPKSASMKPVDESNESAAEECHACESCRKQIPASLFVEHLATHSSYTFGEFKCNMCEYTTRISRDLKDHLTSAHYGMKRHVCPSCNAGFAWTATLHEHFSHACGPLKTHKCDQCRKRFISSEKLAAHWQLHSVPNDDGRVITCKICRKSFETPAFIQHLDVHVKRKGFRKLGPRNYLYLYACPMLSCQHQESRLDFMREHLASKHHGIKPYVCAACGTAYKSVHTLRKHTKYTCRGP